MTLCVNRGIERRLYLQPQVKWGAAMDVTMWGMTAVGAAAIVGGVVAVVRRRPSPADGRRRRIAALYQRQAQEGSTAEADLMRRLESDPGLSARTAEAFAARHDLLSLVGARRFQSALAGFAAVRPTFAPLATCEALDQVEALLSLLAERLAAEDFASEPDARLLELLRSHAYFAGFSRRSTPAVRRFFDLLNQGGYDELLAVWPEVVAGWWEDEGGGEPRRSLAHAPELRAAVRMLALRTRARLAA